MKELIWMLVHLMNTNASTFNEHSKHHVLPKFGLERGCTRHSTSHIHDCFYHWIEVICNRIGHDREEAVHFQKEYAEYVIFALEIIAF